MSKNITWHEGIINKTDRENLLNHRGIVVWLFGLSGSGKSTIAVEVEKMLFKQNILTYRLDGDNIRFGLNKDLDFTIDSRMENIRRIGEVAKLFCDAGFVTLASFITPLEDMRELVRDIIGPSLISVFVDCDIEECEKRDPKGLYKKAHAGEIKNFTGISSVFEKPQTIEHSINTKNTSVTEAAETLSKLIIEKIKLH